MKCPACDTANSSVVKTWPNYEEPGPEELAISGPIKRRKRRCRECKRAFFTYEIYAGDFRRIHSALSTGSKNKLLRTSLLSKNARSGEETNEQ